MFAMTPVVKELQTKAQSPNLMSVAVGTKWMSCEVQPDPSQEVVCSWSRELAKMQANLYLSTSWSLNEVGDDVRPPLRSSSYKEIVLVGTCGDDFTR